MKRLLVVCLMILCMLPSAGLVENSPIAWYTNENEIWNNAGEHFEYEIEGDHAVLTRYWLETGMPQPVIVRVPENIGNLRLTAIGDNAFNNDGMDYDGEKVECIVIPEGVTELKEVSFQCAHDVQRIELPSSLKVISSDFAFSHVTAEISFPNGNPNYQAEDGFIIDIRTNTLVYCNPSAAEKPLPRVKRIEDNALENYSFYQSTLEFPDSVEYVGTFNAFDCVDLETIIVPGSVVELAENALSSNTATEIILNEGLRKIGAYAFDDTEISSIIIPSTVEWIGLDAFGPAKEVLLLNPDCHMETEEEYILRKNDEDYGIIVWEEE